MIEIPAAFNASTVAREGVRGETWIAELPALVERLCAAWSLELSGPTWHGYVGIVLPVTRAGEDLVLKVSWIDQSSEHEALTLRTWGGRGAVRLLEAREELGAMLLERLDRERTLMHLPADEAARIAGALLRRLHVPAPRELRTVGQEMDDFASALPSRWNELGRPFPHALVEQTLERARSSARADVLRITNQDLHYENVLAGVREPWLVIDPKALAGDAEFGVVQLLWNRFEELESAAGLERRMAIVTEAAELDLELARRWAVVRVVDYWIWALEQGLTEDPVKCRTLLEWLDPTLLD